MVNDTLLAGYGFSRRIIAGNIEGVTHEESLKQPAPSGDCVT